MPKIEDYPKHYQEFLSRFRCEEDCWDYTFMTRWPDGFRCGEFGSYQTAWSSEFSEVISNKKWGYYLHKTEFRGALFPKNNNSQLGDFSIKWWLLPILQSSNNQMFTKANLLTKSGKTHQRVTLWNCEKSVYCFSISGIEKYWGIYGRFSLEEMDKRYAPGQYIPKISGILPGRICLPFE